MSEHYRDFTSQFLYVVTSDRVKYFCVEIKPPVQSNENLRFFTYVICKAITILCSHSDEHLLPLNGFHKVAFGNAAGRNVDSGTT